MMRRHLITLDIFKATALIIAIGLQTFEVSGLRPKRDGALRGFEMMSGLFFELSGLAIARSACGALTKSEPWRAVISRQVWRASLLLGASVLFHATASLIIRYVIEPLGSDAELREIAWSRWSLHAVLQPILNARALTFHGACQLFAAPLLFVSFAGKRTASIRAALVLLSFAFAVLVATPALRQLADEACCCVPEHAAHGHRRSMSKSDSSWCDGGLKDALNSTRNKPAVIYPNFRVPVTCERVVGDGSPREHYGTFDPCDFTRSGPPYLPPCASGSVPPEWPPCQRVLDLSRGGDATKKLCDIHPSAMHAQRGRVPANKASRATATCRQILSALAHARGATAHGASRLSEELDGASLGMIWCPAVSDSDPEPPAGTPASGDESSRAPASDPAPGSRLRREVIAAIRPARPFWRGRYSHQLSEEELSHLVTSCVACPREA